MADDNNQRQMIHDALVHIASYIESLIISSTSQYTTFSPSNLCQGHLNRIYSYFQHHSDAKYKEFTLLTNIDLFYQVNDIRLIKIHTFDSLSLLRNYISARFESLTSLGTDKQKMRLTRSRKLPQRFDVYTQELNRGKHKKDISLLHGQHKLPETDFLAHSSGDHKRKRDISILHGHNKLPKTDLFAHSTNDHKDLDFSLMDAVRRSASNLPIPWSDPCEHPAMEGLFKEFILKSDPKMYICTVCKEKWFCDHENQKTSTCGRKDCSFFSFSNGMDPLCPESISKKNERNSERNTLK